MDPEQLSFKDQTRPRPNEARGAETDGTGNNENAAILDDGDGGNSIPFAFGVEAVPSVTPSPAEVPDTDAAENGMSPSVILKKAKILTTGAVVIAIIVSAAIVIGVIFGGSETAAPSRPPATKFPASAFSGAPTSEPIAPTPAPEGSLITKAFESTAELYQAVDNYMVDPTLTAEYGATLNDWDVSRIQVFDRVFDGSRNQVGWPASGCEEVGLFTSSCKQMLFNEDLNKWNTSKAISMNAMFINAREFNGDISMWDVSRVTSMESLFEFAQAFNRDLSQWNTGSVTMMQETFQVASAFNQPIGNWNVSRVTTTSGMFNLASSYNQDLSAWDVGAVTNAFGMFRGAYSLNQDLCTWRTKLPSAADVGLMFFLADECPVNVSTSSSVGSTPLLGVTGQYWCHECNT